MVLQLILVATLFASAGHVFTMLTDDGPYIDPNGIATEQGSGIDPNGSSDKGFGVDPNGSRVCYSACLDPNG